MEGLDRGQRRSLRQEPEAKHPSQMLEIQSGVVRRPAPFVSARTHKSSLLSTASSRVRSPSHSDRKADSTVGPSCADTVL